MKKKYIRLDDACPKRDIEKWNRMEALLDKYQIKPLVGLIPNCKDPEMDKYEEDNEFWSTRVPSWLRKGWYLALHGYEHVFCANCGGINPVNKRSEFAGLPLDEQREKIKKGLEILGEHGISPQVFFAPAHTFDENTLEALKLESNIRVISDTPTNDSYSKNGFTFIPQQSGHVRRLPFKTITFCYHPNIMVDADYEALESFIKMNDIFDFDCIKSNRKLSIYDRLLMKVYYISHLK